MTDIKPSIETLLHHSRGHLRKLKRHLGSWPAWSMRHAEFQKLRQERDKLEEELATLRRDLEKARQMIARADKFRTLREADLHDLQGRYRESMFIQEQQLQLLNKLSQNLSLASRYLHALPAAPVLGAAEGQAPKNAESKGICAP
jgi:uncharacterized protein (DUF3084 family)